MALSPARRKDRLRDIVEAAQALVRERGGDGFSMAELAARAGVSPSTPYNRVGSRAEVLKLVVEAEFASFVGKLETQPRSGSPLADLLAATALVVVHYEADRDFYRALYGMAFNAEVHDVMQAMGQALWRSLVGKAMDEGELSRVVGVEPLTDVLLRTLSAATLSWLAEDWDHARFDAEMALSVGLILAPLARPDLQAPLLRRVAQASETCSVPRADGTAG